ncbi:ABC transporter substrate-binding protein [Actinomycetota bacterium]
MNRWSRKAALATSMVASALLVASCGAGGRSESSASDGAAAENVPGVTDTSVKIGAHFPLTGVAAPGYSEIPSGAKAYFDYVNSKGGIHGRKIEYIVKDDAYVPTNTTQVVNELVQKDQVFAIVGGLGTPTHSAVVDFLNSEKVPDLFVSSGSIKWGDKPSERPMTFGWQPDYEIEGKIIGKYIKEKMPDAKIGLYLQDDDLGADGAKGLKQFVGDQVVKEVKYTPGNTDVAPQIAALQASKADLVVGFNVPSYTALSQLTALKLNYKPKWFYTNVGSDPKLVGSLLAKFSKGAVKDGNSALDGIMTTEYIPGVDSADDPWVKLWTKVWDEQGKDGELTNYRVYGMSQAYAFVSALQASGKNLTREGIVKAIEDGGGKWKGPNKLPFRYSADSHLGISGVEVVEIKKGIGQGLQDPMVTDLGDAEITADSGTAEQAPNESGLPDDIKPAE